MPSFDQYEIEAEVGSGEKEDIIIDFEFEIYCSCGAGICHLGDTRRSHRRSMPQLVMKPCEKCIGEKDEEIKELKELVEYLRDQIPQ